MKPKPMPVPMQTIATLTKSCDEPTPTVVSIAVPTSRNANDATHIRRYPIRSTTGDPIAEPMTTASIIGVRTRPASVADDCSTTTTKSGRNETIANITMPRGTLITLDARNAGTRKRLKGISGSVARRSATMNATSRIALPTNAPMITGEPHA